MEIDSKENTQFDNNYLLTSLNGDDLININEDTLSLELQRDTDLILLEIAKIKKAKNIAFQIIANHIQQFDLENKLFDNRDDDNESVKKEIVQVLGTIKDIRECLHRNDTALLQYTQDKAIALEMINGRRKRIQDNLFKFKALVKSKRIEISKMKSTVVRHKKISKENRKKREDYLEKSEKLKNLKSDLKGMKKQLDEFTKANQHCLEKKQEIEKESQEVDEILREYHGGKGNLLWEMNAIEEGMQEREENFLHDIDQNLIEKNNSDVELDYVQSEVVGVPMDENQIDNELTRFLEIPTNENQIDNEVSRILGISENVQI